MKTSIVITVYNRPDILVACLRALALCPARIDEIVVSDDGSNDENVARMQSAFREFPFEIKYVWQEDVGYRLAAARNNGILKSTGDYVISLDCDILLMPGTVDVHIKHARKGYFLAGNRGYLAEEASIILVGTQFDAQLMEDYWRQCDKKPVNRAHRQFVRNLWLRRFGLAPRHKPKLLGCHFSLFREDIERVNGFDENFTGWGLEDDDFSMRLHSLGVKGYSVMREAHALHLWHPPVSSHPAKISNSSNYAYFMRQDVKAYCDKGMGN